MFNEINVREDSNASSQNYPKEYNEGKLHPMKIYRHYKNKYYKLHQIAVHSETLEELPFYECLYPNPSGQFWVRPKELFFGTIEHNGQTQARFEEVSMQLKESNTISQTTQEQLQPLLESIFHPWNETAFHSRMSSINKLHLATISIDGRMVGFKLGYELDSSVFYSWLGGVHPEFRNFGVGQRLMTAQHEWCLQEGYQKIQTKTQNRFKTMLRLNLKFGFDIVGTQISEEHEGLNILLEKNLAP